MKADIEKNLRQYYKIGKEVLDNLEINDDEGIEMRVLTIEAKGVDEVKWTPVLVIEAQINKSDDDRFVIHTGFHYTGAKVEEETFPKLAAMLEDVSQHLLEKDEDMELRWLWCGDDGEEE